MSKLNILPVILLLLVLLTCNRGLANNRNFTDGNKCPKTEKYDEAHVVPRYSVVRIPLKKFCLAIPPVCTYYNSKLVKTNETITVQKTRTVYDCCKGYQKQNKSCVPVCESGCAHGECIEPNVCHCEEGWRGDNCTQPCELNRYGKNCRENCSCEHGAECDRKTGFCHCTVGYTGTYCEFPCPEGTYGLDCNKLCTCENGALCDIKDGYCECQPGYYGENCEFPCEPGYHGPGCEFDCICIRISTETCNHIDGKCTCKPGFTGEYCEQQCSNFTYGLNCKEKCRCNNADFCDPINGDCFCGAGWIGESCSEKCPEGFFGYSCKDKCQPCQNENKTCNHVTGYCSCPPGYIGEFCENACPKNQWGTDCSEECKCSGNSTCHVITGECICNSGWTGHNCNETCTKGKFGQNCTFDCLCDNCNAVTGKCGSSSTGYLLHDKEKGGIRSLIIGILCVLLVLFIFFCVFCGKKLEPSIRNRWKSRNIRSKGASRENMIGVSFPNPLYDTAESTGNSDISRTERSVSFIDLASTIRERLSFVPQAEAPRASSFEVVTDQESSLKRASKISNLSNFGSSKEVDRSSKTASFEPDPDSKEDFIPETISDFNTPENIIGKVADSSEIMNEIKKKD